HPATESPVPSTQSGDLPLIPRPCRHGSIRGTTTSRANADPWHSIRLSPGRAACRPGRAKTGLPRGATAPATLASDSSFALSLSGTRLAVCRRRSDGTAPRLQSAGNSPETTPARASCYCRRTGPNSTRPAHTPPDVPRRLPTRHRASPHALATASARHREIRTPSRLGYIGASVPGEFATEWLADDVRAHRRRRVSPCT